MNGQRKIYPDIYERTQITPLNTRKVSSTTFKNKPHRSIDPDFNSIHMVLNLTGYSRTYF